MVIKKSNEDYLRSILFGFEDGLVSTTGVVVGVSAGTQDPKFVILAGLVTIAVEAISMGAGQYVSERAIHQLDGKSHTDSIILTAVFMFSAYFLAGLIPVSPFLLLPLAQAIPISIILAFAGLFALGYAKGKVIKTPPLRSGLEILLIGGIATMIGLSVGFFLKI